MNVRDASSFGWDCRRGSVRRIYSAFAEVCCNPEQVSSRSADHLASSFAENERNGRELLNLCNVELPVPVHGNLAVLNEVRVYFLLGSTT